MDFGLSDEQKLLQETVRGFVEKECTPERVRAVVDGAGDFRPIWSGLKQIGLAGLVVEERFGGAGLGILDAALVAEVLGWAAAPGPFLEHTLACLALSLGGDDALRARWLPALAAGDRIGTVALAEPVAASATGPGVAEDHRWDPLGWTARPDAGRLSAARPFVPHASVADLVVVGTAGGGLAVVERTASGVAVEPQDGSDRTRPLGRIELRSASCTALSSAALGARLRDACAVLLAADAFGGASRLVEMSAKYALVRQQFGQPIGQFQGVKHQLANMAASIEPARALYWYAAYAFDDVPQEAERATALAKAHLTDRYMEIARAAVEVHGGIGFTWECDVHIWYKRALFDRAFLGIPAIHRARYARLAGW